MANPNLPFGRTPKTIQIQNLNDKIQKSQKVKLSFDTPEVLNIPKGETAKKVACPLFYIV
jgi:hypothetical protein